ncbi:hypothetical protein [Cytobacillus purgationiresistens]|uniref:Uncharacterized protein n=1 Tax=Cytobacillus purgationiresistens TaxID=863449 RepID=A0ABU0ADI8_9BACI|nr:hypothetical protein [Cytobacillus purgationiresistens]MDQ0268867.1 hypothetical protein [Cytobacillus purgationiresistens]
MRTCYKYDKHTGVWIPGEEIIVEWGQNIPEQYTDIPVPQPCWNPVFDPIALIWIETASEDEKNPPEPPYIPTDLDEIRLALAEMDLMRVRDKTEMQLALAEAINALMGAE